jgi:hypothetical protein
MKFLSNLVRFLLPILFLSNAVFSLNRKSLRRENPVEDQVKSIKFFTIYRGNLVAYDYFKYLGDKTFLCIILLFFQSKPIILVAVTMFIQILMAYLQIFLNFIITDLIPIELFQLAGLWAYFLSGATILYELMFEDAKSINEKIQDSLPDINLGELKSIIRILGIITISRILDGYTGSSGYTSLSFLKENAEWHFIWIYLGKETSAFIIACVFAILIGFFLAFMKRNNNLFIASVTYLLLGMNISLNYLMIK